MKFHGDWLPEDMERFRKIEGIFRNACLECGFGEVRTPVIEKMHWFTGAGVLSPERMHKVYTFLDWDGWSGERVVLRPDNTVPVCRLFSQYYKKEKSAKFFYVEDVFLYNPKKKTGGRHCQMGVELIGNFTERAMRDLEVIVLAVDFLKKLGIGRVKPVLSHAGILHAYLKALNMNEAEEQEAFYLLLEGRIEDLRKFCSARCELEGLTHLLEVRGASSAFLANLKTLGRGSPDYVKAVSELEAVAKLLEALGHKFEIFPGFHKDLTYYTGVMFDIYVDDERVGGGGRYDQILESFPGKTVDGCGFCLYLEPLLKLLEKKDEAVAKKNRAVLSVDFNKPELFAGAIKAAKILRKKGLVVEVIGRKDKGPAGALKAEIAASKKGAVLKAKSGKKTEAFYLTLKNVKKLQEFWGIRS